MYNKTVRSLIAKAVLTTALGVATGFVAMSTTGASALAAGATPAKHAMTTKHTVTTKHVAPAKHVTSKSKATKHSATRDALFAAGDFNSAKIMKALHGVPGIVTMNANSKNKHVWARFDTDKTSSAKIEAALKKAGAKPEAIRKSSPSAVKKHTTMKHSAVKKTMPMKKGSTMKKTSVTPAKKMGAKTTTQKTTTTKK